MVMAFLITLAIIPVNAMAAEDIIIFDDDDYVFNHEGRLMVQDFETRAWNPANLDEDDGAIVPGEVLAPADSLEHAQIIADAYGLELISYAQGIAVMRTQNPELSVFQSQIMRNGNLPTLSFNWTYSIYYPASDYIDVFNPYIIRNDEASFEDSPRTANSPPSFGSIWRGDGEYYQSDYRNGEIVAHADTSTDTSNVDMAHWQHEVMDNERAWALSTGAGVIIAVIDTGIETTHPAFNGRILPNSFNSYTNQVGIWAVEDDEGHGTHVSGIAAGAPTANSDISGVASEADIMAIKANIPTNPRYFNTASLLRGINFAVENGAHIINMSLGRHHRNGPDTLEHMTITNAVERGVTIIAAAGNDSHSRAGFPAAYPEVIAVSSARMLSNGPTFDNSYSNFGPEIDIAAPGTDILAAHLGGGYRSLTGTSMAAPNAAGTAALVLSLNQNFTPDDVRLRLTYTARQAGILGGDLRYGSGIVNSYAALLGPDALHRVTYTFSDVHIAPVTVRVAPRARLIRPAAPQMGTDLLRLSWSTSQSDINLFCFQTPVIEDMTLYEQWVEHYCATVHYGLVGTMGGADRAPWRLCECGILIVDEGVINWFGFNTSPWHNYRENILEIIFTGPITAGTSLSGLFAHLQNAITIEGLYYFTAAHGGDTSRVTNMSRMFYAAISLTTLDLSGWNTSSVLSMNSMFRGFGNVGNSSSLESLNLSGWDTSQVVDMGHMFFSASRLTELDLSGFDTSSVRNMSWMLATSAWRDGLFDLVSDLTSLNLSGFDTSNVTDMSWMFWGVSRLDELDLSSFDTSNVTNMSRMFSQIGLTTLDLSGFNTSSVTNMNSMFSQTVLATVDLSGFNTSNVTNMNEMFFSAARLTELDVSNFNTSSVTSMSAMFSQTGLTTLDLSGFDTSSVTNMNWMFWQTGLTTLDLSSFDTSNVTSMNGMFGSTNNLRQIALGELFHFVSDDYNHVNLTIVPTNSAFTGRWQNIGDGTADCPHGQHTFTSPQLVETSNAGIVAGETWVWQRTEHVCECIEVTVYPQDLIFTPGQSYQFSANVVAGVGIPNTVTWSVSGYDADGTGITDSGLLTIAGSETARTLTVTARSTFDPAVYGTAIATNTYDFIIYPRHLDFGSAAEGFSGIEPMTVTITNISSSDAQNVTIRVTDTSATALTSAADNSNWVESHATINEIMDVSSNAAFIAYPTLIEHIAIDEVGSFTITPVQGLGVGTHLATIAIRGYSNPEGWHFTDVITASFTVIEGQGQPSVNRDALGEAITEAESRVQANYTPASWLRLTAPLNQARNMYNNTNATQAQVDNATSNLRTAIGALVPVQGQQPVVDRDALRGVIADAESRVQANYTPASWLRLTAPLNQARNMYNNANATQAQVNTATNNLITALNNLVVR